MRKRLKNIKVYKKVQRNGGREERKDEMRKDERMKGCA